MIVSDLKQICNDLLNQNKNSIVFDLLDFYFPFANCIEDINLLGEISVRASHSKMFLECAKVLYSIAPSFESRTNLYLAYKKMNYPEEALKLIDENLKERPKDFSLLLNQAFTTTLLGEGKKAYDMMRKLKAKTDGDVRNLRYGLSTEKIEQGNIIEGLRDFHESFYSNPYSHEKWNGKSNRVCVIGEGGIGDEIINIRFFHHLKERNINAMYFTRNVELRSLFARHEIQTVSEVPTDIPWINSSVLPSYLKLKEKDLWYGNYLQPLRKYKTRLTGNKIRIGIKCNGNPYFSQDIYRRIPIEEMLKHIPRSKFEIYYLDKEKTHIGVHNMKDYLNTWEETLDIIDQLHIIVSSCTSLPHVSGAMGKPTIVLAPIMPYYTWTSTRTDGTTPWYGNHLNICYQTKVRDWYQPLQQMSNLIAKFDINQ